MTKKRSTRLLVSLALLSGATLMFETSLTRFLAVSQHYHFAFLVVSLALLGLGASGSLLSVIPSLQRIPLRTLLARLNLAFALSLGLCYGMVNWLPFDSYSIAWDRRQLVYFALTYLFLSLPFLISGLGIGAALSQTGKGHYQVYGFNLLGSALGVGGALAVLEAAGVPGAFLSSALLAAAGGLLLVRGPGRRWLLAAGWTAAAAGLGLLIWFSWLNLQWRAPLGLHLSPYKGLSQRLQHGGADRLLGRWSAVSRVDLIADPGMHSLPGLSYAYEGAIPGQIGLSLDAGPPQPISLARPEKFQAADWLPEGPVFSLESTGDVLVVDPGGGAGLLQALRGREGSVTALVENRLLIQGSAAAGEFNIYRHPRVEVREGPILSLLQQQTGCCRVVYLPLTDAYQPVSNGAFSLREEYLLTREGIHGLLQSTEGEGMLVTTRWLQYPPSEGLRLANTIISALVYDYGISPEEALVVYRGVQTLTIVAKPSGWSAEELAFLRGSLEQRRFDLVWAPDVQAAEINRFNRLPEPVYFLALEKLLSEPDREKFLAGYPFQISAPTANRPFFFHFFTWQQTPDVLAALGHTWQPFGGSGYFLLLLLLGLVLLLSGVLIAFPLLFTRRAAVRRKFPGKKRILAYFGLIGLAFMLVEIPLIQRWILLLGFPEYAFAAVVGGLLLFSGLGSVLAGRGWLDRFPRWRLLLLPAVGFPLLIWLGVETLLGWSVWSRWLLGILGLVPLGLLMGIPFPVGLTWIKNRAPGLGPWAWAVNGCTSVTASLLASLAALRWGFAPVLAAGGLLYLAAGLVYRWLPA